MTLAQIANNAYIEIPDTYDWVDVNGPWNLSSDFGWEKNGLRGHVFASEGNETIIISLKGTSPAVFLGGGTGGNDKVNVPLPRHLIPRVLRLMNRITCYFHVVVRNWGLHGLPSATVAPHHKNVIQRVLNRNSSPRHIITMQHWKYITPSTTLSPPATSGSQDIPWEALSPH
jgi:hypothetical protein